MASMALASALRSTMPPLDKRSSDAKLRLAPTDSGSISPSVLRSSGISAMPLRVAFASLGEPSVTARPSTSTSPLVPRSTPNSARRSSRWPCPSSPPSPTISPGLSAKEMPDKRSPQPRFLTSSTGGVATSRSGGFGG